MEFKKTIHCSISKKNILFQFCNVPRTLDSLKEKIKQRKTKKTKLKIIKKNDLSKTVCPIISIWEDRFSLSQKRWLSIFWHHILFFWGDRKNNNSSKHNNRGKKKSLSSFFLKFFWFVKLKQFCQNHFLDNHQIFTFLVSFHFAWEKAKQSYFETKFFQPSNFFSLTPVLENNFFFPLTFHNSRSLCRFDGESPMLVPCFNE